MAYDLVHLRAFLVVAETGSVGRAAERLNITQPALSRMIRKLEGRVGDELFERQPSGMRLTPIGQALLPHARALKQGEEAAREDVDALRGLSAGTLRIGCVASAAAVKLPALLREFVARWPGVSVEVVEGVWDELEPSLVDYRVDLVLATSAPDSEAVVAVGGCGWREPVRVVVAPDHPLRRVDAVTLDTVARERWAFLPKGTEPHARWAAAFSAAGLAAPKPAVSTTSIAMIKTLVRTGDFVSWLTEPMYREERESGRLCAVDVDGLSQVREMGVYRRREGRLALPAVRFLEAMQRAA